MYKMHNIIAMGKMLKLILCYVHIKIVILVLKACGKKLLNVE